MTVYVVSYNNSLLALVVYIIPPPPPPPALYAPPPPPPATIIYSAINGGNGGITNSELNTSPNVNIPDVGNVIGLSWRPIAPHLPPLAIS
jgi:hypothetical protein